MRRMAFKKQFVGPILDATKATTLRASTKLEPGDEVLFTCEWGKPPFAHAVITQLEHVGRAELTEADAAADGFPDLDALLKFLAETYPGQQSFVRLRFACLQGAELS